MARNPTGFYDSAYIRALLSDANVGQPYTNTDGERLCDVDGLPRTDREIFELIWGPEEAERIPRLLR